MSQEMDVLQKEKEGSCICQSKTKTLIQQNADFDEWLGKRDLALRHILWQICSNTYSDWIEPNTRYKNGVRHVVKLGTFWYNVSQNQCLYFYTHLSMKGPKKKWAVRKHVFIFDQSRVRMALVKKVARWKTRHASKLALRHHVLPQKREAHCDRAPIWIDICFAASLRDVQSWRANGARRRGSAIRQVRVRGWITKHCHIDAVS